MSKKKVKIKSRVNPAVWGLAEWLYKNISCEWELKMDDRFEDMKKFTKCSSQMRNFFYDQAKKLLYSFQYNAFT